ncbi:signal peptidase II [Pelagibacterales bacterium SAG-MED47]|nr:signal peptidase II [Pelagibacterales bacterium SAG-MED47]
MSNYLKKSFFVNLLLILIIFSLDRISKFYVISQSEKNLSYDLFQSKFLNISLIWNEGIAFGLLSFDEKYSYNLVTMIIFIVILILLIILFNAEKLSRFGFVMIIGGALGNFVDRIFFSAVPDFIDFYFRDFHWFVFNIADIFITLGVICLIYDEVFMENNVKNETKN